MGAGKRKQAATVARLQRQAQERAEARQKRQGLKVKTGGSSKLLLTLATAMLASSSIK